MAGKGFSPKPPKGPKRKPCECCGATMTPGHKCPPSMRKK